VRGRARVGEKTFDPEHYKDRQRAAWSAAADAYGTRMVEVFGPLTDRLLALLAPVEGQRVLDVASGPGEPALSIARALGGSGRVVGTDLAEGMVAEARRRAAAEVLDNAEFHVMDAEALDFPNESFDTVVSALATCSFLDPIAALHEMRRVCKRNGRILLLEHGRSQWDWLGRYQEPVLGAAWPTKRPRPASPN